MSAPIDLVIRVVLLLLIAWVAVVALGKRSASLRAFIWAFLWKRARSSRYFPAHCLRSALPYSNLHLPSALPPPANLENPPGAALEPETAPVLAPAYELEPVQGGESSRPLKAPPLFRRGIPWGGIAIEGMWGAGVLLVFIRILLSHLMLFRLSRRAGASLKMRAGGE